MESVLFKRLCDYKGLWISTVGFLAVSQLNWSSISHHFQACS